MCCAAALAGCASVNEQAAGRLSELPAIGLPADAPARPAAPPPYPAVHDMPAPRSRALLTDVEQQKMEDDLVAARTRQQASNPTARKATAEANRRAAEKVASGGGPKSPTSMFARRPAKPPSAEPAPVTTGSVGR
jgi:hypothetical protein